MRLPNQTTDDKLCGETDETKHGRAIDRSAIKSIQK